jgi:hypothetical protein
LLPFGLEEERIPPVNRAETMRNPQDDDKK